MRICICTTPIRPVPTDFPPLGSLAIIQALKKLRHEVSFYNIDYLRPSASAVAQHFSDGAFDVVGISAVVSTAYAYTKNLVTTIKRVSPHTTVIVGGNLAASAEILLRLASVDMCVVGDGELIIQDVVTTLANAAADDDVLRKIPGICFIDKNERFVFTGYAHPLSAEALESPDYTILEDDGSIGHYVPRGDDFFENFKLSVPPELRRRRKATVITSKGCVARCTFCHRWERGYRVRPSESVLQHIIYLRDHYDVGFLDVADENFGSNRAISDDLVAGIGTLGLAWRAEGVRTRTVDPERLRHWKRNGCIAVFYGIESGSQRC